VGESTLKPTFLRFTSSDVGAIIEEFVGRCFSARSNWDYAAKLESM
jgi:hypothetical protein